MSNIQGNWESGKTLYFVVLDGNGNYWDGLGFISLIDAIPIWSVLPYPLVETGGGVYIGNFPLLVAGIYYITGFEQSGIEPTWGDQKVLYGSMNWDGDSETAGGDCTIKSFSMRIGNTNEQTNTGDRSSNELATTIETGERSIHVAETEITTGVTKEHMNNPSEIKTGDSPVNTKETSIKTGAR